MYEIFLNTDQQILLVENLKTGEVKSLKEMGISFLLNIDNIIQKNYPESYKELEELHGSGKEMLYSRVRQFLACNFSFKDGMPDIDDDWNFILEKIPCPARITGLCKKSICNPLMTNELSDREIEVLRLFAKGFCEEEISEVLFISKNTVHNHINNMYHKINVAGKSSPDRKLVSYAYTKGLI